jgi:hypothetical protein
MQVYLFWQPWLAPIAARWQIPISKTPTRSPSSRQRVPHDPVSGDDGGQNYLQYREQDADHQLLVFVQRIDRASEESRSRRGGCLFGSGGRVSAVPGMPWTFGRATLSYNTTDIRSPRRWLRRFGGRWMTSARSIDAAIQGSRLPTRDPLSASPRSVCHSRLWSENKIS